MSREPSRFGYQLTTWLSALARVANVVRFLDRNKRAKLFLANEILRARLPLVALETLAKPLPDSASISLGALAAQPANCSVSELLALAVVTRLVAPNKAVEIGTFDGRSTLAIAANLPEGGMVHTLNLPPDYLARHPEQADSVDAQLSSRVESGYRWRDSPLAGRIRQHFGDSRQFDFTTLFPAQLFFIDGAHDTATVLSDSRNALRGIDRGHGAILWADAEHYGVPTALAMLAKEGLPIRLIAGTDMAIVHFRDGAAVVY